MNRQEVLKLIGEKDGPNTTTNFMLRNVFEPVISKHSDKAEWTNKTLYGWLSNIYGFINAYKGQELVDTSKFTWAQIPEIKDNVIYLLFNHRHTADYTRFEHEYLLSNHQFVDCFDTDFGTMYVFYIDSDFYAIYKEGAYSKLTDIKQWLDRGYQLVVDKDPIVKKECERTYGIELPEGAEVFPIKEDIIRIL
jgi:hypothetical protein